MLHLQITVEPAMMHHHLETRAGGYASVLNLQEFETCNGLHGTPKSEF